MSPQFLSSQSDIYVGRRSILTRYLVCSMEGLFPVLTQVGPASLAVIVRTGAPHVGITGTLSVAKSEDGGKSWSDFHPLAPRGDDVRNPAFGTDTNGNLVAAYWKASLHYYDPSETGMRPNTVHRVKPVDIPDMFIVKSQDGKVWDAPRPYKSPILGYCSPYGQIVSDEEGTLYMCVYGTLRELIEGIRLSSTLIRSYDNGETWGDETLLGHGYNETAYAFLPNGTLYAVSRSDENSLFTLFSKDKGRTWTDPKSLTRALEHPACLTVLHSGNLLLTFGRRVRPMGCGALISRDNGQSWDFDKEVLLAGDGIENFDLGYPSTVQLEDGTIVTALYYTCGSQESQDKHFGWGQVSCQAIVFKEEDIS
jgi:hypothetical protein